jgi:hypothetical protein
MNIFDHIIIAHFLYVNLPKTNIKISIIFND